MKLVVKEAEVSTQLSCTLAQKIVLVLKTKLKEMSSAYFFILTDS